MPSLARAFIAFAAVLASTASPGLTLQQPAPGDPPPKADQPARPRQAQRPASFADVKRACDRFEAAAPCKGCAGTGVRTKKERREVSRIRQTVGPDIVTYETIERQIECSSCRGLKVSDDDAMHKALAMFIRSLDSADMTDQRWSKGEPLVIDTLARAIAIGLQGWELRLNDRATELVSGDQAPIAEPIVVVGRVTNEDGSTDVRLTISASVRVTVIADNPRLLKAAVGDRVLVGGILTERERGSQITLHLRNAFVVRE